MLVVKILGAILALGIGIYLGLGGRYRPDLDEIDRALSPGGKSRKVKTHFTPLGWLRRTEERRSRARRRERGGSGRRFNLVVPESGAREREARSRAAHRDDGRDQRG
jgi:hypothetical protein